MHRCISISIYIYTNSGLVLCWLKPLFASSKLESPRVPSVMLVLFDSGFCWTSYHSSRQGRYKRVKITGVKHCGWYALHPGWKVNFLFKRQTWEKDTLQDKDVLIEERYLGSPSSNSYGRVDLRVDISSIGKGLYYHHLVAFCLQTDYDDFFEFKAHLEEIGKDVDHGDNGYQRLVEGRMFKVIDWRSIEVQDTISNRGSGPRIAQRYAMLRLKAKAKAKAQAKAKAKSKAKAKAKAKARMA